MGVGVVTLQMSFHFLSFCSRLSFLSSWQKNEAPRGTALLFSNFMACIVCLRGSSVAQFFFMLCTTLWCYSIRYGGKHRSLLSQKVIRFAFCLIYSCLNAPYKLLEFLSSFVACLHFAIILLLACCCCCYCFPSIR